MRGRPFGIYVFTTFTANSAPEAIAANLARNVSGDYSLETIGAVDLALRSIRSVCDTFESSAPNTMKVVFVSGDLEFECVSDFPAELGTTAECIGDWLSQQKIATKPAQEAVKRIITDLNYLIELMGQEYMAHALEQSSSYVVELFESMETKPQALAD